MEDVMTFLEYPWVKKAARSKYMADLIKFLSTGRKVSSILAKFHELPEEYVLGALEALESLGVIKSIDVRGEKYYVLTSKGRIINSFIQELRRRRI